VHLSTKQGAGLGLSIVQSVVRAHHGRVEVHSEPGIGTTFIVSLPACDPSELVRPTHEGSPEEVSM
jgi:signal transduction histidine kinase